jgi:hypothetical protein
MPSRRVVRALLGAGIVLGAWNLVVLPLLNPEQLGLAVRVYTVAAEAALAGEPFYELAPPGLPGYYYIYPPAIMLAFLPYGLLGNYWLALGIQTAISVAAGLGLAWLLVRAIERADVDLARLDVGLLGTFCVLSTYTAPTLVNGQVNLVLGFLIGAGLLAAERGRSTLGGAALGLAGTVKLFPAVVGAYLLRRRQWRAAGAAIATGLGLLGLGLLVFGIDASVTYVTAVLPSEVQTGALAADPLAYDYQTVRRQLAALLPWLPVGWIPAVGALVVAPLVAATYRHVETAVDRWFAILATLAGALLILPFEPLYYPIFLFPLLPLLYVVPAGRARLLLLVGTALTLSGMTPSSLESSVEIGLVSGPLRDLTAAIFRVILPGTLGMWLMLGAALDWQWRGRPAEGPD